MEKYPSHEEIKECKHKSDIVFGDDLNVDVEKISSQYIFPKLKNVKSRDSTPLLLCSNLFSSDKEIAITFLDRLHDFCWENNINLLGTVHVLVGWDFREMSRIDRKKNKLKTKEERNYVKAVEKSTDVEMAHSVYLRLIDVYNYVDRDLNISEYPEFFQRVLENSYDEIRDRVIRNIKNTVLPLDQQSLDEKIVFDDIEHQKQYTMGKFQNNKSLSKIEQDNHFLSYLKKDHLEITDDYKLIFSGHTSGFSLGYTDKAILLSLDKKTTLRELKTNLKFLQKYNNEHGQELISLTNNLIEFIDQNKAHIKYVPFKTLAKKMGISKNVVKRYAKELIGIREQSFLDNFDDIKTYTK